jgi:hypothetical protein
MRFTELLEVVGDAPLFESGLLLSGDVDPGDVRRQLSRWVSQGRITKLRRGLYALAPPFRRRRPHPFLLANQLVPGSYVSLQSALAHHGLIPEHVPVATSVTTGRPGRRDTALGAFDYHRLHRELFDGYRLEPLGDGQSAFVATPAKALADLVHLVPGADSRGYLESLRLDPEDVARLAAEGPRYSGRPKLRRAFERLASMAAAGAS